MSWIAQSNMENIIVISLTGFIAAFRKQKITVVLREDTLLALGTRRFKTSGTFWKKERSGTVGENLTLLGKHQEKNNPGKALRFSVYEGNFLTFTETREGKKIKSFPFCIQKKQSLHFVTIIPLKYLHFCASALVCVRKMMRFFSEPL